jgi:hypothetical protein
MVMLNMLNMLTMLSMLNASTNILCCSLLRQRVYVLRTLSPPARGDRIGTCIV